MHKFAVPLTLLLTLTCGCGPEAKTETTIKKKPPIVKKRVNWLVSHEKAVAKSKESGKPIFAFFTGSDWCKYCSLLDHQILNTETFAKWSKENVVLLELDFPRETPIDPKLKEQNEALVARYQVSGFPTVLILTADGKPILRAGYESVTAEQWVNVLDMKMNEALGKLDQDTSGK